MLESLIYGKLKTLNKKYTHTGNNFIMTTCLNPKHFDTKPSFSINTSTGFGKCFGCGYTVVKEYWINGKLDKEQIEMLDRNLMYQPLLNKKEDVEKKVFVVMPPKTRKVEEGYRGFLKDTIDDFSMYICDIGKYKNRVVIPLEGGFFDTRALGNEQPKYLRSYGYTASKYIYPFNMLKRELREYVVITEGIMDCLSLWQEGIPSVCNFGLSQTNLNIEELVECGVESIYIMFDRDEYGTEATTDFMFNEKLLEYFDIKHANTLPELKKFYESTCKDFNEYLQKKE